MKAKDDILKLLTQQLILHSHRFPKRLIVFRRVIKSSNRERVVEVKGFRSLGELDEIRQCLLAANTTVTAEDPPAGLWTPDYRDRVVWKLQVLLPESVIPTATSLSRGSIQLLLAPLCDLCHSDDHHHTRCIWRDILYMQL